VDSFGGTILYLASMGLKSQILDSKGPHVDEKNIPLEA
jgi:hypothetical protein